MDIITQNEKINYQFSFTSLCAVITSSLFYSSPSLAELAVTATASAESIFQDVNSQENENFSFTTISVNPSVNASYQSRTFNGLWQGKITHLERSQNNASREDTYSEYSYSANWAPLDESIIFQASGALSYQNAQAGNFLATDFFTNSDALAKTRSNRVGVTANLSQGNWVRATGQASYSDVASERNSLNSGFALNNDSYQLSGSLTHGDEAKYFIWELTGNFQNTGRAQGNQGDFISRSASGYADFHILEHWALRMTASHEGNQISSRVDSQSLVREFNSYGVGITYRQSENRFISITTNKTKSDLDNDDNETFVGLDMKWALSTRTQISAAYGRRFFGETASANISYNSKYLRSAFSYSENVTNVSRLLANPENLGVFVCPVNSAAISSCFQPDSLNYVPSANEEFVQITTQNLEFNDDIIIRKSSNFQIGYDFSRVTLGISWRYSEDDALDQDRLTRTYSAGSTLAYQLGSYTNINASVNYAEVTQRSETFEGGDSENWNASLGLERAYGESLTLSADLNYIERKGDLINGGGAGIGNGFFGSNFIDRRITLGIRYTYK